jgi:hypothetical protein
VPGIWDCVHTTQAAKLLDDNLKKAVEDADLSESAVIECVKSMLGYHLLRSSWWSHHPVFIYT